jgi:hypothetical protein
MQENMILDIYLYKRYDICMKTTLNIPDSIIRDAKLRAIQEGKTLTDLLVEGLRIRLARSMPVRSLPVSRDGGGLAPGVDWASLEPANQEAEEFR